MDPGEAWKSVQSPKSKVVMCDEDLGVWILSSQPLYPGFEILLSALPIPQPGSGPRNSSVVSSRVAGGLAKRVITEGHPYFG